MKSPVSESISLKTMDPVQPDRLPEPELDQVINGGYGGQEASFSADTAGGGYPGIADVTEEANTPEPDNVELEREHAELEVGKEDKSERGSKPAAGGMRNVLKSGIFGGEHPSTLWSASTMQ